MRLKTFRIVLQSLFFALFLLLFFMTTNPYSAIWPVDIFLHLDPLVAVVSMIAARTLILTLSVSFLVLGLTFLFGRFFCGYVCPLGALIDFFQWLLFRKHRRRETLEPKPARQIKYLILIGVLIAAVAGWNTLSVLSPMAITPRFMATVFYSSIVAFANFVLDLIRPLLSQVGMDGLAQRSFKPALFGGSIASLLLMSFILISNFWQRRFWCRYVCPSGAFFSLFSRFGLIKRHVDSEQCTECERCMSVCDMRAITLHGKATVLSECTLCGNCSAACPKSGNHISFTRIGFNGNDATLHVGRREFMYSAAAGLASAAVVKHEPTLVSDKDGRFIRPPGALPESEFLARCIRCGECLKTCTTYGLQPSGWERGLDGLWTPRLVPRIGGCEEKCNLCGFVCPTHAIRALPLEEKAFVKIGTAVIDKERCIAWERDRLCLICDEICPYDAIVFKIVTTPTSTMKRPFVLADKCTGCGMCETKCPTSGRSAIEVYSLGEERKRAGSYITPEKIKMRAVGEYGESGYGAEAIGSSGNSECHKGESLPGGFVTE